MGILDFLTKKSPAAPAPAGATETTAAPADALKAEIIKVGFDASKIDVAVDGSTVTLTGSAGDDGGLGEDRARRRQYARA